VPWGGRRFEHSHCHRHQPDSSLPTSPRRPSSSPATRGISTVGRSCRPARGPSVAGFRILSRVSCAAVGAVGPGAEPLWIRRTLSNHPEPFCRGGSDKPDGRQAVRPFPDLHRDPGAADGNPLWPSQVRCPVKPNKNSKNLFARDSHLADRRVKNCLSEVGAFPAPPDRATMCQGVRGDGDGEPRGLSHFLHVPLLVKASPCDNAKPIVKTWQESLASGAAGSDARRQRSGRSFHQPARAMRGEENP